MYMKLSQDNEYDMDHEESSEVVLTCRLIVGLIGCSMVTLETVMLSSSQEGWKGNQATWPPTSYLKLRGSKKAWTGKDLGRLEETMTHNSESRLTCTRLLSALLVEDWASEAEEGRPIWDSIWVACVHLDAILGVMFGGTARTCF